MAALIDVLRARGSHYSIYGAAEADTIRLASDLGHEALINAMAARDPGARRGGGAPPAETAGGDIDKDTPPRGSGLAR
ncbi:GntR family transcriptional regulator, partial [Streptomyces sp. NPDC059455]